jgi:uncharacterized protein YuzE
MRKAKAHHDPEADAIGIYFAPDGSVYQDSEEILPGLTLDFDTDGKVIGVEILGARQFLAKRVLPATEDTPAAE